MRAVLRGLGRRWRGDRLDHGLRLRLGDRRSHRRFRDDTSPRLAEGLDIGALRVRPSLQLGCDSVVDLEGFLVAEALGLGLAFDTLQDAGDGIFDSGVHGWYGPP